MKFYMPLFIAVMSITSAFGMDKEKSISVAEDTALTSPLCLSEVRVLLIDLLFRALSFEEALWSLKALMLTDKSLFNYFQEAKDTGSVAFIEQLQDLSCYEEGFDLSLEHMQQLRPFLSKEIYTFGSKGIQARNELIELCQKCAETANWDPVNKALEEFNNNPLRRFIINFHWEDSATSELLKNLVGYIFRSSEPLPIKRNLCTYACELNAPLFIIEQMHSSGATIRADHERALSPLFVILDKLIACKQPDSPFYKELEEKMDKLCSYGASVNHSYHHKAKNSWISPLTLAIFAENEKMISALLEKGSLVSDLSFRSLLAREFNKSNDLSCSLFRGLLSKARLSAGYCIGTLLEFVYSISFGALSSDVDGLIKKKQIAMLNAFFDLVEVDFSALFHPIFYKEGLSLLECAKALECDEAVSLFIEKGAIDLYNGHMSPKALSYKSRLLLEDLLHFLERSPDIQANAEQEKEMLITDVLKVDKEVIQLLENGSSITEDLFPSIICSFLSLQLIDPIKLDMLLFFLIEQEPLSLRVPGYGEVNSVLGLLVALTNYFSSPVLPPAPFPSNKAEILQISLGQAITAYLRKCSDSMLQHEGELIGEKAHELNLTLHAEYIKESLSQEIANRRRTPEEKWLHTLKYLKKSACNTTNKNQLLVIVKWGYSIWNSLSLQETRELLKAIAKFEPLPFAQADFGPVCSVFQWLVLAASSKQDNHDRFQAFLEEASSFITWLKEEGIEDKSWEGEKTAAQRARDLGMGALADIIEK